MSNIPNVIYAGDTLDFTESISDYLASDGWTAKLSLRGAENIDLTSSANGDDHDFDEVPTTTAGWKEGFYNYQLFVEKGTDRYTIKQGRLEIKVNLATQGAGYESRSTARIILDALEERLKGIHEKGHSSISIGNMSIVLMDRAELRREWHYFRMVVEQEEQMEKIERGDLAGKKILARMKR